MVVGQFLLVQSIVVYSAALAQLPLRQMDELRSAYQGSLFLHPLQGQDTCQRRQHRVAVQRGYKCYINHLQMFCYMKPQRYNTIGQTCEV